MRAMSTRSPALAGVLVAALVACGACGGAPRAAAPCFTIRADSELRAKDAKKTLEDLVEHIQLAPEDERLREPRSLVDVKAILRRDAVYFFAKAAAFARTLDTTDGRFSEAQLELLLGESQLVASQILGAQEAWVGGDLRLARANLATEGTEPHTDRGRMLVQLIRVVEEGNKIADALGVVARPHLARGAEVTRQLRAAAPTDPRTFMLVAEYHRLRGEWPEFDAAMKAAGAADRASRAVCYLRGMEQLERYRRPDRGAVMMRECLASFPTFVRAQAALVLMADKPEEGVRALEKLKAMNQDHYLVMLLEPTLAADQELRRMQKQSEGTVDGAQ
jgi:hypothetical protein